MEHGDLALALRQAAPKIAETPLALTVSLSNGRRVSTLFDHRRAARPCFDRLSTNGRLGQRPPSTAFAFIALVGGEP